MHKKLTIPDPRADIPGLLNSVQVMKQAIEQLQGIRGEAHEQALTVEDHTAAIALLEQKQIYGDSVRSIRNETGTAYTLTSTDQGKILEMENGSANTLTIPPNAEMPFPRGAYIYIVQAGAGTTTVAAGSGVTLRSAGSLVDISAQWGVAMLYQRLEDVWVLSGDLA